MTLRWEKWTGPVKGYYAYAGDVLIGRVREYKEGKKKYWAYNIQFLHFCPKLKVPFEHLRETHYEDAMDGIEAYWHAWLKHAKIQVKK